MPFSTSHKQITIVQAHFQECFEVVIAYMHFSAMLMLLGYTGSAVGFKGLIF